LLICATGKKRHRLRRTRAKAEVNCRLPPSRANRAGVKKKVPREKGAVARKKSTAARAKVALGAATCSAGYEKGGERKQRHRKGKSSPPAYPSPNATQKQGLLTGKERKPLLHRHKRTCPSAGGKKRPLRGVVGRPCRKSGAYSFFSYGDGPLESVWLTPGKNSRAWIRYFTLGSMTYRFG